MTKVADKTEEKTDEKPVDKAPAATQTAEQKTEEKVDAKPVVPDGYVPLTAVQEERKKRQERERALQEREQRIAYLEGQLAANTAKPDAQDTESFDETEFFTKPGKAVQEVADRIVDKKVSAREKERFDKKVAFSRNRAIKKFGADEYQAMEAEFASRANQDKSLWEPVGFLDDPASYVVEMVTSWRSETDAGSKLSAAEARIAELEAKLRNGGAPGKETMPASQAGSRGSGATSTSSSRKQTSDSDMLGAMLA